MAVADDIRSFLEGRLQSLDPTIDLSPNSPAQAQIIQPTVDRFAEDPFSTDIPSFLRDRMLQEHPDLAADNGGLLEDILTKPFQLLLEPFKREIQLIKRNQSVRNAALMSEDEADALGANWFEDRNEGDFAGGGVRIYFAAPNNARVTTDKRVFTAGGLSYFPVQNYSLPASQMLFNRQGNLYFLDIVVRAEAPGAEYNIGRSEIIGIDDVSNVLKVTNLSPFSDGAPRESNEEYLGRFDQALTERSFVTKRGILSRVPKLFDSIRAMQVVGAGQEGMNRDILTGTGQGFLHIAGSGMIYGNWLWLSTILYKDDGPDDDIIPQEGDTIRVHVPSATTTNVKEGKIEKILTSSEGKYLFLLEESLYETDPGEPVSIALFKPGTITISNVPGGMSSEITVPDNEIHLGGHTDVFVRPTEDAEVQSVLESVTDDSPILALTDLTVPEAGDNRVTSTSVAGEAEGFAGKGIEVGDTLVIETGTGFVGTYRVLAVDDPGAGTLRVDSLFPAGTTTELRARIVRNLNVDLVSPRIPKLPFNTGSISDLQTTVGSNEVRFLETDIQFYGAAVGDTLNIVDGPDAGEYTIIGFPALLGGQGAILDRIVTATGSGLRFEVYTKLSGLTLPLVRVKSVEVLDSSGQGTGVTVPYGDAVDIRPTATLEGAGKGKQTLDQKLIIFPDLAGIWDETELVADPILVADIDETTDARYTQELEQADGVVRTVTADPSNPIVLTEINVPPFCWNGKKDKVLVLPSKTDVNWGSDGDNKTSDLAEASIGDTFTILGGPNAGRYVIKDKRLLELWGKADEGHRRVALLQVDPPFKVDPIRSALDFMMGNGVTEFTGGGANLANELFGFLDYAADWDNASGFYTTFMTQFLTTLTAEGVAFDDLDDLKAFFDPLVRSGYTVGPAAKGDFRLYFLDPVSVEFYFGEDPTTFVSVTDESKVFRVDPNLDSAQIFPESEEGTSPTEWNRNLGLVPDAATIYLGSGLPVVKRGIEVGDIVEFHRAINDLPARKDMSSSWLAVTQTGSNVVTLLFPPSEASTVEGYGGVDNFTSLAPGQLLFIDSGPDIGAYTITKVVSQTWSAEPPVVQVQIDKVLTHTTEGAPIPANVDHDWGTPAYVSTTGNAFPMNLNGKKARFSISDDGGATWTTVEHTFAAADPYNDAAAVKADLDANATFAALFDVTISDVDADELHVVSVDVGPLMQVRVDEPTSDTAFGALLFEVDDISKGHRGAVTVPETKRIYSSGFSNGAFAVDEWVTVFAAWSEDVIETGSDEAYLGTFKVTAFGEGEASQWGNYQGWIEIDRPENFPIGDPVFLRLVRHAEPESDPATTSEGGREISSQFVRIRLYEATSEQRKVTNIPWDDPTAHPLDEDSEAQATLEAPVIVEADDQRNNSHKMPYRILRPGVLRISSTTMATKREGALYFLDVPVVGYGPGSEMNVSPTDGFLISGRHRIDGYTLEVEDENFAYSAKEKVRLVLPSSILPVGSTPELDNEFNLAGQNIQITYNNAPLVQDLQNFFDSPLDRVTVANILVRHFLPAYVFLDATYFSGPSEDVVAAELIKHINNIDPDVAEIRTDLLQDIFKRKGASKVDLPLVVLALVHGTDRRIRGMRSETAIGSADLPFFKGTFNQSYFIAGKDTSKETIRPAGEQIFLRRV